MVVGVLGKAEFLLFQSRNLLWDRFLFLLVIVRLFYEFITYLNNVFNCRGLKVVYQRVGGVINMLCHKRS